jgi:hypothetical protein
MTKELFTNYALKAGLKIHCQQEIIWAGRVRYRLFDPRRACPLAFTS